jgi:hypothetical protein
MEPTHFVPMFFSGIAEEHLLLSEVHSGWFEEEPRGRAGTFFTTNWDSFAPALDLTDVDGLGFSAEPAGDDGVQALWEAIDGLKPSNISRLVRVVRDWTTASEPPPTAVITPQLQSTTESHELFHWHLAEGQHQLLERGPDKNAWTWFLDWRDIALEVLDRQISGRKVLGLLKRALSARCSYSRPALPAPRRATADCLLRLVDTIVAHAPPRRLHTEPLPIEAG